MMTGSNDMAHETVTIRTSCGSAFQERIDELSNRQISGLIEQNPDHPQTPILRATLGRRTER